MPNRCCLGGLIAQGEIETLEQKKVAGKVIEHVESRLDEKDMGYEVARDGTVLATSEGVAYASFPVGLLAAAQEYCGVASKLKVCKEIEHGEIFYE